ncbi:MAG: class I SAM-dependent methyltransferase [Flavobacteriales bacterium]|nr:class I SAM-dependent methyltransferase [Flavobacteriales bacterium]
MVAKAETLENWFITWFNSPYYHILYKNRDVLEAESFVNRLISRLNLPKGSRVLDLACGKGRHSLQFKKNGFDVIGIDLSDESIEEASLNQQDGLDFFVHDMRELYWSEYFNLVVNLFTSFGYFHNKEDDQKTISSVADALKPNGLFVIDYMNAVKVQDNLVDFEEKTIDNVRFEISREVNEGVIVKSIHLTDGSMELDFKEEVDALDLSDFADYLDNAGLKVIETYGSYELDAFDEQTSGRLIIIAQKLED